MIRHTNAIFSILFILIVTSANLMADDIKHEKYTDYKNGVLPKTSVTNVQIAPLDFVGKQSAAAATLVYYGDRPTFDADHPGVFTEDFENTLVPPGGIISAFGPFDNVTNNVCFAPSGILEGIRFMNVNPLNQMVVVQSGNFGLTSATIGPNSFLDDLDIILLNDTYAVGFDIYLPLGTGNLNFFVYGTGDVVLAVIPIAPATTGTFWGVSSDQPITRIRSADGGAGLGELIDNFSYGHPRSVLISGYVKDAEDNGIEGVATSFSNGGVTVSTDVNGHYITSVSWGWTGTSTASMAGYTFTPMNYAYSTPVNSNQTDQDFTATQLPNSLFISGNVRDQNNNGIEGVAVSLSNGGATVNTNAAGFYTVSVAYGWNGTATPSMAGNLFSPSSIDYPPVTVHQNDQNYSTTVTVTVTPKSLIMNGFVRNADGVGINAVAVTFSNGGATVYTNVTGEYTGSVAYGWNGTATAFKAGYSFLPLQHTYPNHLTTDQLAQDFTAMTASQKSSNKTLILPAYPNPFNPSTTLTYGLNDDSNVSIDIYDISGKLVMNLVKTTQTQGWHSITWNGTNQNGEQVPAGMYFSMFKSGNNVKTTKLMLLK